MERLTYDCCLGDIRCWQVKGTDNLECRQVCEEQEENGCKGCPIALAVDRLAAYEDTGLTPEEVQQMRWIPVEERLPENRQDVLFYQKDGFIYCAEYNEGSKLMPPYWSIDHDCWEAKDVTHWMPLPKPPKEATHD